MKKWTILTRISNYKISVHSIKTILGLVWLLDGFLQLQPKMFTSAFANRVIVPAAQNQPLFIGGPMRTSIHIFLMHPAIFNSLFALTQIAIGAGILWNKTTLFGLKGSILWGLFVWYLGEGLGGLFTGNTSILMGYPGAALIYAVIALSILHSYKNANAIKPGGRPAYWLPLFWSVIWLSGALLVFLPLMNTSAKLGSMITSMGVGAPRYMRVIESHTGSFVGSRNDWFIIGYALILAFIGLAILIPGWVRKLAVATGILAVIVFWVVGQNLGAYYSGVATDPGSSPLYILLGLAILSCERLDASQLVKRINLSFSRLEKTVT